jgi:hypothetical protein
VRAAIHPDHTALLIGADRFADGDELMRYRISLFSDPHGKRATVNVFHNVNLELMFGQRQATGSECQSPLSPSIVDGQAHKIDKRGAGTTLRFSSS